MGKDHFPYKVLPFDLSIALRVFTKYLPVVAAHLRKQGLFICAYLHDWLVKASLRETLLSVIMQICSLFANLGLWINWEKLFLEPTQRIVFIGATLDSIVAELFFLQEREVKIKLVISLLPQPLEQTIFFCRDLKASPCLWLLYARLQMKVVQQWLASNYRPSIDSMCQKSVVPRKHYEH